MPLGQIVQAQVTDADPHQSLYLKPQLIKHAPNLPINALAQDDPHAGQSNRLHLRHFGPLPVEHDPGE